jgi:hypothetical protein
MSITSSSVLVELNISVWTANKLDRDTTNKLTADNGAAADAAQVRKNLMSGSSRRKDIADYAAGCRLWHNSRTLPWADRGARLLPTSLFMDYKQEANARRDRFQTLVDTMLQEYEHILVPKAMNSLGDLFNPADYPNIAEVREKFGFRLVFSPVPDAGDFRLDIPKQELDEMRAEYDTNFTSRIEEAMRTPWEQLHKMLGSMSDKLVEPDSVLMQRRWHDTFITNAQDMCQMLTHLNVTKDPKLEDARRKLEVALIGVDIDDIKENEGVRANVKSKLDAILSGYEW